MKMTVQQLLSEILSAEGPNRELDRLIALLAGYKPRSGSKRSEEFWASPSGVEVINLPRFTESIQDGLELARYLFPTAKIGCSWDQEYSYAKIGETPYQKAYSISLALCAAIIATSLINNGPRV